MIKCPKCGATSPDEFIACRECFEPFETPLDKQDIINKTPLDLLPFVLPSIAEAPDLIKEPGQENANSARSPEAPLPSITPVGSAAQYAKAARNLRTVGLVLRVGLPLIFLIIGFWLMNSRFHMLGGSSDFKPNQEVQRAFDNMNSLDGWIADVHISANKMMTEHFDQGEWEGQVIYSPPDRLSFSANSREESYALIIIGNKAFTWDAYFRYWDQHPVLSKQKKLNPIWDDVLYSKLSAEKQETEEMNGITCQVYYFNQELKPNYLSLNYEEEIRYPRRYEGKFYVDLTSKLLIAMQLKVTDTTGSGWIEYDYAWHDMDEMTKISEPAQQSPQYSR